MDGEVMWVSIATSHGLPYAPVIKGQKFIRRVAWIAPGSLMTQSNQASALFSQLNATSMGTTQSCSVSWRQLSDGHPKHAAFRIV
jgi:hypothetical protein